MIELGIFWERCFEDLEVSQPPPCTFDELQARYSEPHRAYHTLQHLSECFSLFNDTRPFMKRPGVVAIALFYHDAIYDTHRSDNEEQSADLAERTLNEYCRLDNEINHLIRVAIMATKHNVVPASGDDEILVDIDLSILGANTGRFDEYERQVRKEYEWVPEADFCAGRGKILREFLGRPAIYSTGPFRGRFEQSARHNLERSLRTLGL
jgi:predicted metal-dependent HD superfamily phosphohydrolase